MTLITTGLTRPDSREMPTSHAPPPSCETPHARRRTARIAVDEIVHAYGVTVIVPGGNEPDPGPREPTIATEVRPPTSTAAPATTYQRVYQRRRAIDAPAATGIASG